MGKKACNSPRALPATTKDIKDLISDLDQAEKSWFESQASFRDQLGCAMVFRENPMSASNRQASRGSQKQLEEIGKNLHSLTKQIRDRVNSLSIAPVPFPDQGPGSCSSFKAAYITLNEQLGRLQALSENVSHISIAIYANENRSHSARETALRKGSVSNVLKAAYNNRFKSTDCAQKYEAELKKLLENTQKVHTAVKAIDSAYLSPTVSNVWQNRDAISCLQDKNCRSQ